MSEELPSYLSRPVKLRPKSERHPDMALALHKLGIPKEAILDALKQRALHMRVESEDLEFAERYSGHEGDIVGGQRQIGFLKGELDALCEIGEIMGISLEEMQAIVDQSSEVAAP